MVKRLMVVLALLLVTAIGASSAPKKRVVAPEVAKENAQRTVREISWQTSLSEAESLARSQGKLVFWMHMLGKIDGDT